MRHLRLATGVVVFAVAMAACEADTGPGGPGSGPRGRASPVDGPRLEVSAVPRQGGAPLVVRFTGRLTGNGAAGQAPRCPSVAWSFGDGPPQIEALRCSDGAPAYAAVHEYVRPGAYDVSLRLLGVDIQPSAAIQVLVVGPTVTPAPEGRLGFPPAVVIATPVPRGAMTVSPPALTPGAATRERPGSGSGGATAPPTRRPGTAPSSGPPAPVLPADLLYLSRGKLRRLPASGGAPADLVPGGGVTDFAVSSLGDVAYLQDGDLRLRLPGGEPPYVSLDEGVAAAPVWSPEGRRLAWGEDEISVYDVAGGRRGALPGEGKPLAWSRDAGRLLVAGPRGNMALVAADGSSVTAVPVAAGGAAGWLADREVVWLARPGLRLLTLGDPLQLTSLAPESTTVGPVFLRPDRTLLALVSAAGSDAEPMAVDLKGDSLSLVAVGPAIRLGAGEAFAWGPDGRTGAVAGPEGVSLVDTVSGGRVQILDEPASHPAWAVASPPAPGG